MKTFHNPVHSRHAGRHEMYRGHLVPCHEVPDRLEHVLAELRRRPLGQLLEPGSADRGQIARVHSPRYLDFLEHAWDEWIAIDPGHARQDALPAVWPVRGFRHDILPASFAARIGLFSYDAGTPLTAGTWQAAMAGAACAQHAAAAVAAGDRCAFALTRPPGHHAGPDFFGGYCFINNAAIAAQALRERGAARVAVLDIDYHHGNGTQTIFYQRADVLTVSLHGDPHTEYPFFLGYADERGEGDGLGCNLNLPLARGTGFDAWSEALETGLQAVKAHGAEALVVPMGMDTFEGDPISGFHLRSEDYLRVGDRLRQAGLPTVFTFEGGYAVAEVGVNAVNLLQGFAG